MTGHEREEGERLKHCRYIAEVPPVRGLVLPLGWQGTVTEAFHPGIRGDT